MINFFLNFFKIYNGEKSKTWRRKHNLRNFFRLEKETKGIKNKVLRDIKNIFDEYYKPVRVNHFWSNYIDYKSNSYRYRILSVDKYLDKSRPYLKKDIINYLRKSGKWKIQLTVVHNFISSIDDDDEEPVMHWQSDNIEIIISDEADNVIKELFDSLKNRFKVDER